MSGYIHNGPNLSGGGGSSISDTNFDVIDQGGYSEFTTLATNYWSFGGALTANGLTDKADIVCNILEAKQNLYVVGNSFFTGTPTFAQAIFNDQAQIASTFNFNSGASVYMKNDVEMYWGDGFKSSLHWDTGQTNDNLILGVGQTSRSFIVSERNDVSANHGLPNFANPTIALLPATPGAAPNAKHFDLYHDGTYCTLTDGVGTTLTPMMQFDATKWAIHGSTPVTKPAITGSRAGNAALASLLTALASQGICTDSTT
jgi:hypothetical protein